MRIKEGYVMRRVADIWIVMPVDNAVLNFNGMLTLNESGAFLWEHLASGVGCDAACEIMTKEYNVTAEQAKTDIEEFCKKLIEAGCAEP